MHLPEFHHFTDFTLHSFFLDTRMPYQFTNQSLQDMATWHRKRDGARPTRVVNDSSWGVAQILSEQVGVKREKSVYHEMPKIRWWTIDLWTSMDYGGSNECYVMYLPAWSHCFLFSASLKIFWRCRKLFVIFFSVLEVPGFVESVLQSSHAAEHGFDIRDAALMVTWWANIGPIELLCVGSWWRKSTPSRSLAGQHPGAIDLRFGEYPIGEGWHCL